MSSKSLSAALIVVATILVAACSPRSSLYTQAAVAGAPAPDIQVLHADTIVVAGRHLRLAGEVAPQPAPHAHCVAEAVASRQARVRLTELASGARHVTIRPTGGVDSYNRTNAEIRFDGADPVRTLIDEGLAVAPGHQPIDWCGPISQHAEGVRHIAMLSISGS